MVLQYKNEFEKLFAVMNSPANKITESHNLGLQIWKLSVKKM